MEPKIRVWVCFSDRTKFGKGRARLFELIDELGSINKAVEQMGMSYRAAWGYIRELESAAGFRILERTPGRPWQGAERFSHARDADSSSATGCFSVASKAAFSE